MSKSARLFVGFLTIWPLIYFIFFILFLYFQLSSAFSTNPPSTPALSTFFPGLILVHFLTFFLMIGLIIGYIRHAYRNKRIASGDTLAWAIMLFIGSIIAQSIYWYIYIWKGQAR